MDLQEKITAIILPVIEGLGYELVRVRLLGQKRLTLQIMADRADGTSFTVEDCASISHAVSASLDVEDPISAAYTLEVSSPGIDRPLTRLKDFVTWSGFEAKLETASPIDGRKNFRGIVESVDGDLIRIAVDDKHYHVPFNAVANAKLILTDALIAAATASSSQTSDA